MPHGPGAANVHFEQGMFNFKEPGIRFTLRADAAR